ncbi:rubrerythrin-like domain-containing protein [Haloferax profundi]|nr:rubrerythrin-like domain-containing protein [Haloferax profundi]
MRDVTPDTDSDQPYECFQCGTVIVKDENPGRCPDCSGRMRNRGTPLE